MTNAKFGLYGLLGIAAATALAFARPEPAEPETVVRTVLVGLDCAKGSVIVALEEDDPAFDGGCRDIQRHEYAEEKDQ